MLAALYLGLTVTIFFIQYHAEPKPEAEDFLTFGGAYVNCWINADNAEDANRKAQSVVSERVWRVVAIEEECGPVTKDWYQDGDEALECYLQAVEEGESCVFFTWPNEAQDDDAVH